MTDKPEALKWADALETELFVWDDNTVDLSNEIAAELRRLHAENETLRRLLQTAVDFDEACRLPDWKIPQWVIESMAELAKAEGARHE